MTKDDKANQPMDDSTREVATPVASTNAARPCYAIKTLVAEVLALFPETPVEYTNYDGRNAALSVSFDMTSLSEDDRIDMTNLMTLLNDPAYNEDQRIEYVIVEDEQVLVTIRSNPRTQDSRARFGLADALSVLAGDEEPDDGTNAIAWENDDDDDDDPWLAVHDMLASSPMDRGSQ